MNWASCFQLKNRLLQCFISIVLILYEILSSRNIGHISYILTMKGCRPIPSSSRTLHTYLTREIKVRIIINTLNAASLTTKRQRLPTLLISQFLCFDVILDYLHILYGIVFILEKPISEEIGQIMNYLAFMGCRDVLFWILAFSAETGLQVKEWEIIITLQT